MSKSNIEQAQALIRSKTSVGARDKIRMAMMEATRELAAKMDRFILDEGLRLPSDLNVTMDMHLHDEMPGCPVMHRGRPIHIRCGVIVELVNGDQGGPREEIEFIVLAAALEADRKQG